MHLMLVLFFSLFTLISCGKHTQISQASNGQNNSISVQAAEALITQILNEDLSGIEIYLNNGGNINHEFSTTGRTVLTESCFWGKFKVVEFIVKRGADVTLVDREGRSPLDYGKENEKINRLLNPKLMRQLKLSVFQQVKTNNLNELKKLLEEKPPLNFFLNEEELGIDLEEQASETLLTFILKNKLENVLRQLAQPKYELDPNMKNKVGESPLSIAQKLNLKNSEKLLLKLGAKDE
jgi:ankyrin repeat protein